jgi:hypothetical protein
VRSAIVIVASILPLVTPWTLWPCHFAFFMARPSLDRLADQIAEGRPGEFPRQVRLFRVVTYRVDATTRNVGLVTDPHPGGMSGLVRVSPKSPRDPMKPWARSALWVDLGSDWEFRQED